MTSLFVVYDSRCGICTQLTAWLSRLETRPAVAREVEVVGSL